MSTRKKASDHPESRAGANYVHPLVSRPLPCPHCGGSAGLCYYTHDTRRCYYACDDSRCHYTFLEPLDALEAWNKRANNRISNSDNTPSNT